MGLTFLQKMKRIIVQLIRLRRGEMKMFEIWNSISRQGFILSKVSSREYEISGKTLFTKKCILRSQTSDLLVFNQVILHEEYKPLLGFVSEYSNSDDIIGVVDAGANIGLTSLYFSSCFRNAKILAVEPSPENFAALKNNIFHNNCTQIIPFQNALWFERSKMTISHAFRDGQDWSLQVLANPSGKGEVESLTISDIMKQGEIVDVDILKMDIEGAEAKLFASREFLDELKKIKFIAVELHEEVVDKISIINLLQDLGFKLKYKGETLFGVNLQQIKK